MHAHILHIHALYFSFYVAIRMSGPLTYLSTVFLRRLCLLIGGRCSFKAPSLARDIVPRIQGRPCRSRKAMDHHIYTGHISSANEKTSFPGGYHVARRHSIQLISCSPAPSAANRSSGSTMIPPLMRPVTTSSCTLAVSSNRQQIRNLCNQTASIRIFSQ